VSGLDPLADEREVRTEYVIVSLAAADSLAALRTLKNTVLTPSPSDRTNVGAVAYGCHAAPAKVSSSLARYSVGEPVQVLFRVTASAVVWPSPPLMAKAVTAGAPVTVSFRTIVSLVTADSPPTLRTWKYTVLVPLPPESMNAGAVA